MKFDLVSDLHIDVNKGFDVQPPNPGSEVLVIAGDVAELQTLKNTGFDIFRQYKDLYREVIYTPGNHEYYGSSIQEVNETLRNHCDLLGVHFFQGDSVCFPEIDPMISFVGGTLWTDMNKEDPMTCLQIKQMMADWTYISDQDEWRASGYPIIYGRFKPEKSIKLFRQLIHTMENYIDGIAGSVVVVTHHAMSHGSITPHYQDPRYRIMNGGFASDCDWFFHKHKNVKVHCHGHMHSYLRYNLGSATVYCNPYGYQRHGERKPNYGPQQIEVNQ